MTENYDTPEQFENSIEEIEDNILDEATDVETETEIDEAEAAALNFIEGHTRHNVKEAVSESLREDGYDEEEIDELSETADRLIRGDESHIIEEETHQPPKSVTGSERSTKGYSYPSKEKRSAKQNVPFPSGKNASKLSQRERLEAMRDGLTEFIEEHNPSEDEREQAEERLDKIEEEIEQTPQETIEETEEIVIEEVSDEEAQQEGCHSAEERRAWRESTESQKAMQEKMAKQGKLSNIKSMYATGIENKGKFGSEALGELMEDWDEQIREIGETFDNY